MPNFSIGQTDHIQQLNQLAHQAQSNTFSQVQTHSAGIKVGNTAQADTSTLDWYEENTFTPTVSGTTVAGAATYTTRTGKFTRIGNQVFFQIEINITAHTGTGNMIVTGLPYTASNLMNVPVDIVASNLTAPGQLVAYVSSGTSQIILVSMATAATPAAIAMDTSCQFWISGNYLI